MKKMNLLLLGEALEQIKENKGISEIKVLLDGNNISEIILDGKSLSNEKDIEQFLLEGYNALKDDYTESQKAIIRTIDNLSYHLIKQAKEDHKTGLYVLLSQVRLFALKNNLSTQETTKKAKEELLKEFTLSYINF